MCQILLVIDMCNYIISKEKTRSAIIMPVKFAIGNKDKLERRLNNPSRSIPKFPTIAFVNQSISDDACSPLYKNAITIKIIMPVACKMY